ncbi:uncharacterized protein J3D65DRAFT_112965 [Phyllosticta citribraziliensis]|uniref:Uncharacterized protein n=1 Tax=Phyllosticta citribraziliensis TaxID=989973 RepID=A0ABR1LAD4_9PEZI
MGDQAHPILCHCCKAPPVTKTHSNSTPRPLARSLASVQSQTVLPPVRLPLCAEWFAQELCSGKSLREQESSSTASIRKNRPNEASETDGPRPAAATSSLSRAAGGRESRVSTAGLGMRRRRRRDRPQTQPTLRASSKKLLYRAGQSPRCSPCLPLSSRKLIEAADAWSECRSGVHGGCCKRVVPSGGGLCLMRERWKSCLIVWGAAF